MATMETLPERVAAARAIMLEIFMDEDDECIPEASFNDPIKAIYIAKISVLGQARSGSATAGARLHIHILYEQSTTRTHIGDDSYNHQSTTTPQSIVDDLGKKMDNLGQQFGQKNAHRRRSSMIVQQRTHPRCGIQGLMLDYPLS